MQQPKIGLQLIVYGPRPEEDLAGVAQEIAAANYDGMEVDLLCETKNSYVAIEMKASREWQKRFNRGLNRIQIELTPNKVKCYGIYRGDRPARFNNVDVLPVMHFLKMLWDGNIID